MLPFPSVSEKTRWSHDSTTPGFDVPSLPSVSSLSLTCCVFDSSAGSVDWSTGIEGEALLWVEFGFDVAAKNSVRPDCGQIP